MIEVRYGLLEYLQAAKNFSSIENVLFLATCSFLTTAKVSDTKLGGCKLYVV